MSGLASPVGFWGSRFLFCLQLCVVLVCGLEFYSLGLFVVLLPVFLSAGLSLSNCTGSSPPKLEFYVTKVFDHQRPRLWFGILALLLIFNS
ncbi:Uncharacterized protein TCM_015998 [Theobroma cacao]|uniref:Uncharacterized protein n=1 Tax=Theobroma cacao TaxID=3641 RepID=A0A061G5A4_THECC|nr:Uncharacterized protein TCM_015998 [Theobroma cacao]